MKTVYREFVAYFWLQSFKNINFGISVCLKSPNLEIHIPFGFFRIGWEVIHNLDKINELKEDIFFRPYGYNTDILGKYMESIKNET